MALLIPIAFAVGFVTTLTPCVLPVLPVILASGGASDTRRRPYAIVAGLVSTFTLFTLAGAWIWSELHIGARYQIRIGVAVLLVVALSLVVPRVGAWLERPLAFLTRRRSGDLGGGFVLGASLGLVFVPCAGPLLAALVVNAGTHRVGAWTVVVLLAFAVGAALPMLAIAQGSRRLSVPLRAHAQALRVAAGILIAAAAVVIYQGWLTGLQTSVPGYALSVERFFERGHTAKRALADLRGSRSGKPAFAAGTKGTGGPSLASKPVKVALHDFGTAPDFLGIAHWFNSKPLSLTDLRGKVVLVDFWTYSCINCLRTLPHLEAWDRAYRSKGLVIVGVHTPEFAFEHDVGNVGEAIRRLGVRYPVAMDNDYATWNAYSNQYWPADYLVDQSGQVRDIHFGEGDYAGTERDIRLLLQAGGSRLPTPTQEPDTEPAGSITPESYLGSFRITRYSGSPLKTDAKASYTFPATLARDHFAYAGTWTVQSQRIVAGAHARLRLHFHARSVHLVLGGKGRVSVAVAGRPDHTVSVEGDRLYTLASYPSTHDGTIELAFTPGVQAYAFTFG
jgi:cytochrome c biogenesis protein CcdA/thiol-disulfide isomerase/thioredoxin